MKKIFTIAALSFALCSFDVQAWNYGEFISCDAINPQPRVIFKSSFGKLIHDLSTPLATINALASKDNSAPKEKGLLVAGLAIAPTQSSIRFNEAYVKKLDENAACLLPAEIEIFVGYKEPLIYVANEFDTRSCTFSVLIRHEQVHQRINKLTLEYFLPLLDEAIREAVTDVRAIKIPNTSDAAIQDGFKQLSGLYSARLNPIIEEFVKVRAVEQNKLDNMTHYKMEWDLCKKFEEEHPDKIFPQKK